MKTYLSNIFQKLQMSGYPFMLILALIVGALGGLIAVEFRLLTGYLQQFFYRQAFPSITYLMELPLYVKFLAPIIGAAVVGPLVYFCSHEAEGHGVPEVMKAVAVNHGIIRSRVVLIKYLASALSIGSGASVGRTGPIVQVAASLGSSVGQWMKLNPARIKTLIGCGAAAGIAATFNAPIAGVLFALEVIIGDFGLAHFSPIVIASVVATVVSRGVLGNKVAFHIIPYQLHSSWELPLYLVMGLLMAPLAVLFVGILQKMEDFFDWLAFPEYGKPVIGAMVVGLIAAFGLPHVSGVGYETIEMALVGKLSLSLLLLLCLAKIVATSITISSGNSGGVFAPSLFIGAIAGGAYGQIVARLFPGVTAAPGAYALVGTSAMVAATTHAPLTAILLLFEMTNNYDIILPLMLTAIVSTITAKKLYPASIYTVKLLRQGINVQRGEDLNLLKNLRAGEIMNQEFVCFQEEWSLDKLLAGALEKGFNSLIIVDRDNKFRGLIYINDIVRVMRKNKHTSSSKILKTNVPKVYRYTSLDVVSHYFANDPWEVLPVLESNDQLAGTIKFYDLLRNYNREVFKRSMASGLDSQIHKRFRKFIQIGSRYSLCEIETPLALVGMALKDTALRERYRVSILLVRRSDEVMVPPASFVFQTGDYLLLAGKTEDVEAIKTALLG